MTHPLTMDHRDMPLNIKRAPAKLTYGKVYENRQPQKCKSLQATLPSRVFLFRLAVIRDNAGF